MPTAPTVEIPWVVLQLDAFKLSVPAFIEAHGNAFFVHERRLSQSLADGSRLTDATAETVLSAFAIRKNATDPGDVVTIGRSADNDITYVDETLSKFHACVMKQPGGGWAMHDVGSRNGTTIDGEKVARKGEGPPTPLVVGAIVRFGSLNATFSDALFLRVLLGKRGDPTT